MPLPLLEKEHNIITVIVVCVHTKYYIIFLCSRNLCTYDHNIW